MKQNTFLMKTDFLENLIYDGFENGPRTVMGQQGAYQRLQTWRHARALDR